MLLFGVQLKETLISPMILDIILSRRQHSQNYVLKAGEQTDTIRKGLTIYLQFAVWPPSMHLNKTMDTNHGKSTAQGCHLMNVGSDLMMYKLERC